MKIATFNVNSIKMRWPIVKNWLAEQNPDVLMIQELKGTALPEPDIRALGYGVHAIEQKTYNGVATLTRTDAQLVHSRLPGMGGDDQARFLSVNYKGLTLINIYAPNGNPIGTEKFDYKIKWLECLYTHLKTLRNNGEDVVIAGDFNIIPEPLDAAHPENWRGDALFQRESRALYRALLHLGYTDTLRALHPTQAGLYSFWDYQAGAWQRNNGIRIDHILLSPRLADHLIRAEIDKGPRALDKPSDHTPVLAEIDL